jgi:hypothetical protein
MFDSLFIRAGGLWRSLIESIAGADGKPFEVGDENISRALETYTAKQLKRNPQLDSGQRKLLVHRFAIEGQIHNKTPLELFLANRVELNPIERQLVSSWQNSFVGLLAIVQVYPNGLEVMNWLTAKHYRIQFADLESQTAMTRLKVGDIIIAQLSPIAGIDWAIFAPWVALGRLGKPKLAVAVGTFRQNYPHYLYPDARELLDAAWESVAVYHDRFVEFFGGDEITLTGKELAPRIAEFQTWMVDRQLATAGIDSNKSLVELAADNGANADEVRSIATTLGLTDSTTSQEQPATAEKMIPSKVELPPQLKHAPAVTALSHPYWGQMFLPDYERIKLLLTNLDTIPLTSGDITSIDKSLKDPQMNAFVWRRLANEFPQQLQTALCQTLNRSDFNLATDLDLLLTQLHKYLEPDLPDLASVPIHLHELFQSAVMEVSKDKVKAKLPPKKAGFGTKN